MYIKRERYLNKIRPFYETDLIKVLAGVRRCGKSVLLRQIEDEIRSAGAEDSHIINVNFEDIHFEKICSCESLNKYISSKITDSGKYYIFLDEIQHVTNFEKILASLRASRNCSIFVTGSNSKLLSGRLGTLLVGRCIEFRIMPFAFSEAVEYMKMSGKDVDPNEFIFDYIMWGGLPMRFAFERENDVRAYLQQTYNGIIEKDTAPKRIADKEKFLKFAGYVMANAGKEFSGKSIEKFFANQNSDPVDKKTLYRYLDKMEQACLLDRVKRFNIVGKKAMLYIEKQYASDTGFRMLNTNFVNFEDTFFLENVVYNELASRGYSVFTGKTYKGEVDFVVLDGRRKCFIQTAYYLNSRETIDREFNAFKPINDASPKYVLSLDRFDFSRDGISHINIVDFLLNKKDISLT